MDSDDEEYWNWAEQVAEDHELLEMIDATIALPQWGGSQSYKIEDFVEIKSAGIVKSPKYAVTFQRYTVTVKNLNQIPALEQAEFIYRLLNHLIEFGTKDALPHHKVRLCIDDAGLHYPIWTTPINKDQLAADRVMLQVQLCAF